MMTSKERLLACIRHQAIDRVPVSTYELVGWNESSWENKEESYRDLMDAIRRYTDCVYMLSPGLRETPNRAVEVREWKDGSSCFIERTYHTGMGSLTSLYREDEGVHTTWTLKHLLEELPDIDKYLSMPYNPPEIDMEAFYRERQKLGDRGLMMISVDDPICVAAELFEMGKFLMLAITEEEKIQYLLDAIHERQMYSLNKLLKHDVKDTIFRICGPEYATPPYLSPEYFDRYVTRYLINMCRVIRDSGGIPRIHSHGKIGRIIDRLAMAEAMCIDPVEPPPDGDIELSEVKRLYGNKFCIFGNIELKELEQANTARIDLLVREAMEAAKSGGGFILMPTASPINVPLSKNTEKNYIQMIESALKYGKY